MGAWEELEKPLTVFTCETDQQMLVDCEWANFVPSSVQNSWFSPEKQKWIKNKRIPHFFNLYKFLWTGTIMNLLANYYEKENLGVGNGNNEVRLLKSLLVFHGGSLKNIMMTFILSWEINRTQMLKNKIWILVHWTLSAATCRDYGQVFYTFLNRDYPQN